jgi:hypothetical protein
MTNQKLVYGLYLLCMPILVQAASWHTFGTDEEQVWEIDTDSVHSIPSNTTDEPTISGWVRATFYKGEFRGHYVESLEYIKCASKKRAVKQLVQYNPESYITKSDTVTHIQYKQVPMESAAARIGAEICSTYAIKKAIDYSIKKHTSPKPAQP